MAFRASKCGTVDSAFLCGNMIMYMCVCNCKRHDYSGLEWDMCVRETVFVPVWMET